MAARGNQLAGQLQLPLCPSFQRAHAREPILLQAPDYCPRMGFGSPCSAGALCLK